MYVSLTFWILDISYTKCTHTNTHHIYLSIHSRKINARAPYATLVVSVVTSKTPRTSPWSIGTNAKRRLVTYCTRSRRPWVTTPRWLGVIKPIAVTVVIIRRCFFRVMLRSPIRWRWFSSVATVITNGWIKSGWLVVVVVVYSLSVEMLYGTNQ